MESEKVDRLSALSALQIAGLAIAGSTLVALATLFGLRRLGLVRRRPTEINGTEGPQPAVPVAMSSSVPTHFSEDVVIPGMTFTGADVRRQDDLEGRSPEGI